MRNRIFAVLAIAILAGGGLAYGTYNLVQNQPVQTAAMATQPAPPRSERAPNEPRPASRYGLAGVALVNRLTAPMPPAPPSAAGTAPRWISTALSRSAGTRSSGEPPSRASGSGSR